MTSHFAITELLERYPSLAVCQDSLNQALEALKSTFAANGKVLLCGNGGSGADCDHIAAELMKSFHLPRTLTDSQKVLFANLPFDSDANLPEHLQGALRAISLSTHNSLATAVGNDTGAQWVFAQQVFALADKTDLLWAISTSGNSPNVLNAVATARALGVKTLALTGEHGGQLATMCDVVIKVPATRVDHIQELHLPVYHALCRAAEDLFFGHKETL